MVPKISTQVLFFPSIHKLKNKTVNLSPWTAELTIITLKVAYLEHPSVLFLQDHMQRTCQSADPCELLSKRWRRKGQKSHNNNNFMSSWIRDIKLLCCMGNQHGTMLKHGKFQLHTMFKLPTGYYLIQSSDKKTRPFW